MKKKLFALLLIATISVVAGFMVSQEKDKLTFSDVMLSNVEALAQNEGGGKGCKLRLDSICETTNGDHHLYRNR